MPPRTSGLVIDTAITPLALVTLPLARSAPKLACPLRIDFGYLRVRLGIGAAHQPCLLGRCAAAPPSAPRLHRSANELLLSTASVTSLLTRRPLPTDSAARTSTSSNKDARSSASARLTHRRSLDVGPTAIGVTRGMTAADGSSRRRMQSS